MPEGSTLERTQVVTKEIAQYLRQSVKKSGYEFKNKLGEWPKGGEVLMRMSSYHTNNLLKEISTKKSSIKIDLDEIKDEL